MRGGINLLEILLSRENWEPKLLLIIWDNDIEELFEGEEIEEKFIKALKRKTQYKRSKLVLYTSNLNILLPWLINLDQRLNKGKEEPKIFISKETAYNCTIEISEKITLTLRNAEKYLNSTSITEPYFYPGTRSKPLSLEAYTRPTQGEGDIGLNYLTEKLKPLGFKNRQALEDLNFFKKVEPENTKEIAIKTKMAPQWLLKRAQFTKKNLNNLNNELLKILPGWAFSYSFSSIALRIFERNFNNFNIKIRADKDLDNKIRKGYIGGRCEIFGNPYSSTENVFHFDFKNMYGTIMNETFPTGTITEIINPKNFGDEGFYEARLLSKNFKIPILPHKHEGDMGEMNFVWEKETNYGIIYSNGEFTGTFYSEELELFTKNGGIVIELTKGLIFTGKREPIFREFAETIIKLRNNSNSTTWKQLLVNFYGRMGMSPRTTKNIIGLEKDYETLLKGEKILKEIWINKIFIAEVKEEEGGETNSSVWYAAIITSRGRIKLWENLDEIRRKGGRPLYCATDSIFAAFKKPTEKEEVPTKDIIWTEKIDDAVFAGINTYSLKNGIKWETRIAGIPRNSIEFKEFKKTFYTNWGKEFKINLYSFSINNKVEDLTAWNAEISS